MAVHNQEPDQKLRWKNMVDPAQDQWVIPNLVFWKVAQVDIHPFQIVFTGKLIFTCNWLGSLKNNLFYSQWIAIGRAGPVIHRVLNLVAVAVHNQEPDQKLRWKNMGDTARDQQVIPNLAFWKVAQVDIHSFTERLIFTRNWLGIFEKIIFFYS